MSFVYVSGGEGAAAGAAGRGVAGLLQPRGKALYIVDTGGSGEEAFSLNIKAR